MVIYNNNLSLVNVSIDFIQNISDTQDSAEIPKVKVTISLNEIQAKTVNVGLISFDENAHAAYSPRKNKFARDRAITTLHGRTSLTDLDLIFPIERTQSVISPKSQKKKDTPKSQKKSTPKNKPIEEQKIKFTAKDNNSALDVPYAIVPLDEITSIPELFDDEENLKRSQEKYKFAAWILEHGGLVGQENKYLWPILLLQDAVKVSKLDEAQKKLQEIQQEAINDGDIPFAMGLACIKMKKFSCAQEWLQSSIDAEIWFKKARGIYAASLPKAELEQKIKNVKTKFDAVIKLINQKQKAKTYHDKALEIIKANNVKEHEADECITTAQHRKDEIPGLLKQIEEKKIRIASLLRAAINNEQNFGNSNNDEVDQKTAALWKTRAQIDVDSLRKSARLENEDVNRLAKEVRMIEKDYVTLHKKAVEARKVLEKAHENYKPVYQYLQKSSDLGHPYANNHLQTLRQTELRRAKKYQQDQDEKEKEPKNENLNEKLNVSFNLKKVNMTRQYQSARPGTAKNQI